MQIISTQDNGLSQVMSHYFYILLTYAPINSRKIVIFLLLYFTSCKIHLVKIIYYGDVIFYTSMKNRIFQ